MADTVDEITKIPGFMRAMKWNNAAALMDRWFAGAPNADPLKGVPDTNTLKMDSWALTFSRAKAGYDAVIRSKLWINDNAKRLILERLKRQGMAPGKLINFGDLSQAVNILENQYLTYQKVGELLDPLDDMYGALGRFTFHIAVRGQAVPIPNKPQHTVIIEEVGIFVRDPYDFSGDQPLGFWNFTTGQVSRTPGWGYHYVENKTFRDWRDKNKKGGDYLAFSDVKRTKLTPPDSFVVDG